MADNLVWVEFKKDGSRKQLNARIANDKNYQATLRGGFTVVDSGATETQTIAAEPQKKIAEKDEPKKVVAEKNEVSGETAKDELGAGVETVDLNENEKEESTAKSTDKKETVEEKVTRLHKEGKSEKKIKEATGINMNTIRSIIKKIK